MTQTFSAVKTTNGRRTTGRIVATVEGGPWGLVGEGTTKQEASSDLLAKMARAWGNTQCGYIVTVDGPILVVRHCGDQWMYDILRVDDARSYCASCMGGADSYDGMLRVAGKHAIDSYGGIVRVIGG